MIFRTPRIHRVRWISTISQFKLDQFNAINSIADCSNLIEQKGKFSNLALQNSSAHLLGWALESKFGNSCLLVNGTASATGFHYDSFLFESKDWIQKRIDSDLNLLLEPIKIEQDISALMNGSLGSPYFINEADLEDLAGIAMKLRGSGSKFEIKAFSKQDAFKLFGYSPVKLHQISAVADHTPIPVLKLGEFVDLCTGPVVQNIQSVQSIILPNTGAAHWKTDSPQTLSRIYGIGFESKASAREYVLKQEEAEKRNHRRIGSRQELFTFSEFSPGSPFFLPHGMRIVSKLKGYLRKLYRWYGFEEVVTPLIFHRDLWQISGHWENYKEDMFTVGCCGDEHDHENGLKPMNCPAHCLLFKNQARSYRDLPLRLAEFSPLHRNEASGALTGLTRVRKFHQDDGHIFCTPEQVYSEIESSLEFIKRVYSVLGFPSYRLALSTRPQKFIGDLEDWNAAEDALRKALNKSGGEWTVKEGDGAFYGPKIDVMVKDSLGREHQTATIQLDFQLPKRFELSYQTAEDGKAAPVIIHRAVLGSIERMLAILIENYGGKWPFWISPRQILVVTTRAECSAYAKEIHSFFTEHGLFCDLDCSDKTLAKKVQEAQPFAYNYIVVIGDREVAEKTITLRGRDGKNLGAVSKSKALDMFQELVDEKTI